MEVKKMTKKILLLFVAIVFVLSSCSDYKKVDFDDTKVKFDIKRDLEISGSGTKAIYTLLGLSINDKEVKLTNDRIVIIPNSKHNIETESIGDIMIRITKEKILFHLILTYG